MRAFPRLSVMGVAIGLVMLANRMDAAESSSSRSHVFFVATNGNDSWSGTLAAPNRRKKDGPFATLPHALQAAQNLRANAPTSGQPVSIRLRAGCYFLEEPVVIKPE